MIVRLVLVALLVTSAFALVTSRQRARLAVIESERLNEEERQLEQDWSQLQLQQTAAAKHGLVEQIARQQLGMQPVTPDRTQYIEAPKAPAPAGGRP